MTDIAIHIENITRDFETVKAVDSLSLEVPSGIIFGFLGPNGAGKTTTINLLLGLLEPTSGRAEVLDFDTRTQADEVIYDNQMGELDEAEPAMALGCGSIKVHNAK